MNKPDFANISNADYVDSLYRQYQADPASVSEDWRIFFAGFDLAGGRAAAPALSAAAAPAAPVVRAETVEEARKASRRGGAAGPNVSVLDLIHSYRELGHLVADLDPLGENQTTHPLLELSQFGLVEADLSRAVEIPAFKAKPVARLGELIEHLRATYCGTVGIEYMYFQNKERREWIQERIEPSSNKPNLAPAERIQILEQLLRANMFEQFLHKKYVGAKRFSLEGAETLIPLLHEIVEETGRIGTREVVMGMPHRGRLNVLAHILGKPYEMILSEFEGNFLADSVQGDGDVKYHLGYSRDHRTRSGDDIHLSLLFNPSHLEAINPVAEGIVAGKQQYLADSTCSLVLPLLMHGDAAFMGQGIVMETLGLSELDAFRTGGTIHLIVNNQIGFTTSPKDYRFTRYPTEVAKLISALTLHANGDDPEAVVQAGRIAAEFRNRFHEDVLIDLVCYRRHGHNELDDPTFTQPLMYRKIAARPPVSRLYADRLVREGVLDENGVAAITGEIDAQLNEALDYARDFMPKQQVFSFGGAWKGMGWAGDDWSATTRVSADELRRIARAAATRPEGFTPHPKVEKLYAERAQMVETGTGIDWGCGEMLALGSLLIEGADVRLSGQDSGRGTFSHRHAALYDMENGQRLVPLDRMTADQGRFTLIDSNLSEAGVLGFEYGFASADPANLVIWEAQFGDFANGAQIIIDQFIASAESKWQRSNGIVLLLPHGYEGQGPEHSSARLERFLNLCAEQNMQVCNLTRPAQLFHALRRQVRRNFRKPLVIMSPKSMLRHKLCVSAIEEFTDSDFRLVLDEVEDIDREHVRRVLLCSGKVYYDLLADRTERNIHDVAIVRVEQLYPFPLTEVREVLSRYPADAEVDWVQEEPKNMGAWRFVFDRNHMILDEPRMLYYVGREAAASPATGSYKKHNAELRQLLDNAFRPSRSQSVSWVSHAS
ncbi:MAG TPA: 2-oxoglutarate dehydrogenase E1 component [Candidatus Limnocylindrales bacterium]|nr:2-oxoglutarate dehydrogenase E1 component [Candidatus Limnocylindrales bacterium]